MREQDDQTHRQSETNDECTTIRMPYSAPPSQPPLEPLEPPTLVLTALPVTVQPVTSRLPRVARPAKWTRVVVLGALATIVIFGGPILAVQALNHGAVGQLGYNGAVVHRSTPTPLPTATPTLVPLPDFSLPAFCDSSSGASQPDCVQCPYTYDNTTYSRAQIQAALDAAADQYQLPRALVYAVAWGESNWKSGWMTCNYDLGVMQLKQGYLATFDNFNEPVRWCPGVERTLYDPIRSMQQNVLLGAKWLAWLRCYYGWMASSGGSQTTPDRDTLAWYYQQAGTPLPDTSAAQSLCVATAQDPTKPWFKDLGAEATDLWSCPFSAKAGDRTFLDIVLAGYNGGPQAMDGAIPNDGYVSYIEGIMTQFAQGQLPPP